MFYVQAQESGTHYLVSRNGSPQGYFVGVTDGLLPELELTSKTYTVPYLHGFTLSQLVAPDEPGHAPVEYQIYSETNLEYRGAIRERRQTYNVAASELGLYRISNAIAPGVHELYIRATPETPGSTSPRTGWQVATISKSINTSWLRSGTTWDDTNLISNNGKIRVAFPDSIPTYYQADELTGFAPLSGTAESTAERLVRNLQAIIPNLDFASSNVDADINVYLADLSSPTIAFAPGTEQGGDIILNNALFSDMDSNLEYLTFALYRAFGKAMGLKSSAPQLSLDDSVMGNNRETTRGVFPSSFSKGDIDHLQELYGVRSGNEPSPGISFTAKRRVFSHLLRRPSPGQLVLLQSFNASGRCRFETWWRQFPGRRRTFTNLPITQRSFVIWLRWQFFRRTSPRERV